MANNQTILAPMRAAHAINVARRGYQPSAHELLVSAVEEAIDHTDIPAQRAK